MEIFSWKAVYVTPILAFMLTTIGYVSYYFLSESEIAVNKWIQRYPKVHPSTVKAHFRRLAGTILMGILPIPFLFITPYSLSSWGFGIGNVQGALLWAGIPAGLILAVLHFVYKNPGSFENYPEIRQSKWTLRQALFSSATLLSYTIAYEILFRGVLLFGSLACMDVWPAIALNVAIYTIAHIPKGLGETLGSILFGTLLCMATLHTGAIWAAVIIHVVLALGNEYISLARHPEIKVVRN